MSKFIKIIVYLVMIVILATLVCMIILSAVQGKYGELIVWILFTLTMIVVLLFLDHVMKGKV